MAKTEIPEITEVQRLRLEPGDALVIRCPQRLSMAQAAQIKEHVRAILRLSDEIPVMVFGDGIEVGVVSVAP